MTQKLLKEISDDEALVGFKMIDDNSSNTINFEEMSRYYS